MNGAGSDMMRTLPGTVQSWSCRRRLSHAFSHHRQREFQEVVDIDYAEDEADRRTTSGLVVEQPRPREVKRSPLSFERASAICQDIADPIRVGPIGQGDDVTIASPEDVDGVRY